MAEFIEEFDVNDYEIETDSGWEPIGAIGKTILYDVYELTTTSGLKIECADDHIVFDEDMNEIFVKDLVTGSKIQSKDGITVVTAVVKTDRKEHMYDIRVDSDNHRFYTNGVLSHNSTTLSMLMTWFSLFNNDKTSGIVAQKEKIAKEVYKRVQTSIEMCPQFLKPGVKEWSKTQLEFDNGSRVICAATTPDGISGFTINGILMIDEVAKIRPSLFEEFFIAMEPTIAAADSSKLVMVSTPKGMNHFYRMWKGAEAGKNGFKPFKVGWQSTPKRTEEWKQKKIAEVGLEEFNQEYSCAFLGSTESLLSSSILQSLTFQDPIRTDLNGDYKIYAEPDKTRKYVLIVDTAEGLGEDYSVINVFDVSPESQQLEQVCMFRSCTIDQTMLAYVAARIGKEYNEAMLVVENNFGSETATVLLNECEYGNLYIDEKQRIGIRNNKKVKRIGVERLREMINNNTLKINSVEALEEFANFIRIKESWGADKGQHDDIVMTMVLFAYFTKTEWYKDYAGRDTYKNMHMDKIRTLVDASETTPIFQVDENGVTNSSERDEWGLNTVNLTMDGRPKY